MVREHIHFVTGRLAEFSLRQVLAELAASCGFGYSIDVLGITVAALMTPEWVARRIAPPQGTTRVILPGYCHGDLAPVERAAGTRVERGPKDLRDLPEFFGRPAAREYGAFDIQILAEINHAPRLTLAEILDQAARLRADGADVIDVGCDPGATWSGVGECVRALRDAGHAVSIDSYNIVEIAAAAKAGALLVLSVNHANREAAPDWGCEVVVVPDAPGTLDGLDSTLEFLAERRVPMRVDPILEPIGMGLGASLGRYQEIRRRWPDVEMLMGIGNLTELTDVDSAGLNVLLLGLCQEWSVHSVLTTQVINWARSSVRECDRARRLVYYAVKNRALPKHVDPSLVMLRDRRVLNVGPEALDRLAEQLKDPNYRVFADGERLHIVSAGMHLSAENAFDLWQQLSALGPKNLDAAHAFYLGYELSKAATALTLGKQYRQDEALDWGILTQPERPRHG